MLIDCNNCVMKDIACGNCVVSHFLAMPEPGALATQETRALEVLHGAGLVPPLRMSSTEAPTKRSAAN